MIINPRQKKKERRKRTRKKARIARRRRFGLLSLAERRIYRDKFFSFRGYTEVKAPKVFSLIRNTVETIGFIDSLEVNILDRKSTLVRLTSVNEIDNGAVVVLLSVMNRFQKDVIPFNGDFPRNPFVKRKIVQSGFIRRLYTKKEDQKIEGPKDTIFTTWRNHVDSPVAGAIILLATNTVYGEPRVVPGIYRVLIELMHNTHNHAGGLSQGSANWYLSIDHDYKRKRVSFSFIDYGVGIFKSLGSNFKPRTDPF